MNTGPIRYVAANRPIRENQRGPSHKCTIRTCVPSDVGENDHSTSISLVIPPTCLNRLDGRFLSTAISDSHQVRQLIRRRPFGVLSWNGRLADISTNPPPSDRRVRNRTYR